MFFVNRISYIPLATHKHVGQKTKHVEELFSVVHVVRVVNVSRRKVLVHFPYIMIPK